MTLIYKILPAALWDAAVDAGRFEGAPIDLQDGYIHMSTAGQAQETARRHFHGQAGLVIAAFRAEDLGEALVWEASRGGALFPHVYGAIDPEMAVEVRPLPLGVDGAPVVGDPGAAR